MHRASVRRLGAPGIVNRGSQPASRQEGQRETAARSLPAAGPAALSDTAAKGPVRLPEVTIGTFLRERAIESRHAWRGAHILSGYSVAKNLLLVDGKRHAQALVSQGRRIDIDALNRLFERDFRLGGIADMLRLYPGVAPQMLWPTGLAAGVEIIVDDTLLALDEIAFDTRDPRCLCVISGADFRRIFRHARRGNISRSF
jgi:prolyl-tRNA editing enzyme YbaK/EbsC (Cys-tRNA(Pro) deacylase)